MRFIFAFTLFALTTAVNLEAIQKDNFDSEKDDVSVEDATFAKDTWTQRAEMEYIQADKIKRQEDSKIKD